MLKIVSVDKNPLKMELLSTKTPLKPSFGQFLLQKPP